MNSIHCFCIQYDLDSLLKIPVNVDLSQLLQVAKATRFLNTIDDWQQLDKRRTLSGKNSSSDMEPKTNWRVIAGWKTPY